MKLWFILPLSIALAGTAQGKAADTGEIAAAFAHLNSKEAMFPSGRTEDDVKALTVLRAHPNETKELVIAALSKGGSRGRTLSLVAVLIPKNEYLETMRTIVSSYDPGELSTARFLGYFAYVGEERDILWLTQFISQRPDDQESVELAKVMAESKNAFSHEALRSLAKRVPGKWQESWKVKEFFGATNGAITKSESAAPIVQSVNTSPQKEPPVSMAVAAKPSGKSSVDAPTPSPWWWRWVAGGVALVAILSFLIFRRR